MASAQPSTSTIQLLDALQETRARTLELVGDLTDEQLMGPRLSIINPLRWEIGHLAWFQEFWVLRHLGGRPPMLEYGDSLYDSARVDHDTRWYLPLLTWAETLSYTQQVLERAIDQTSRADERPAGIMKDVGGYDESYFLHLVLFHEQMHDEAITYTRQTLSYPPPAVSVVVGRGDDDAAVDKLRTAEQNSVLTQTGNSRSLTGDTEIPSRKFMLGSSSEEGFVFDNEQWSHEVEIPPFAISKTALTNAEFKSFVEDAGYRRSELWTAEGWQWRANVGAEHPVYWRPEGNGRWLRRNFDEWVPLEERLPVIHVNWYEAGAYCRWAGRRLPTEAEWELAASMEPMSEGRGITAHKRAFPWGDDAPTLECANLDWRAMGCIPVDELSAGDSAFGCRQMIGNVWEWTATTFGPYPGFVPGPYQEYSQPWFGDHKVLRGGCWVTRSRLIRNAYRNFYTPDRRDIWAGFRTCALSDTVIKVSVIIPALNEDQNIAEVVRSVPRETANELIVVDNGSEDRTAERAREAGARVVTEPRRGYGRACAAGVQALSPDCQVVVFLDGDGSDCPELMDHLVEPIIEGRYDFVIGSRIRGEREPGSLNVQQILAGRAAGLLLRALYGVHYTDMCPFRAIRREALEALGMREQTYGWNLEMQMRAARAGLRILEVPVNHRRRAGGESKVSGTVRGTLLAGTRILATFARVATERQ